MLTKYFNPYRGILMPILIGCGICLLLALLAWAASAVFMAFFQLPLRYARPWTLFQYWQIYGSSPDKRIKAALLISALLPFAAIGFLIFVRFKGKQRPLHGDARFATMPEIQKAGLIQCADKTILVGKIKKKGARDIYLSYGGFQFVMLAAPTRSGKGVSIVVPNCLNYSDSIVVLDIKFENFDLTAGYRAEHGQEVYLFAPFGRGGEGSYVKTHCYNPLDCIADDPEKRYMDTMSIAQAFYPDPKNGDAFWAANARNLFVGLCLYVLETDGIPHTIGEIYRQASGKGEPLKEYLTNRIEEREISEKKLSEQCKEALYRFTGNSDNTLAGILSTFNAPLAPWGDPVVDAATSKSDFNLRDVRKRRMSIYLGIRPDKLADAKNIVNLFFNQLCSLNTQELPSQNKALQYQCLMILDEFTAIGFVSIIATAVSYLAGYNMRLLTIIQNKSQLKDVYGEAGAMTIMANHALMILFSPSPTVQSDAREYSEMLGYQTVPATSKSRQLGGLKSSRSESESLQRRALLLPQEVRELGIDNEIVLLENVRPVFCQKIRYYLDKNFLERANHPLPAKQAIPAIDMRQFISAQKAREKTAAEKGDIPPFPDDGDEKAIAAWCAQYMAHEGYPLPGKAALESILDEASQEETTGEETTENTA